MLQMPDFNAMVFKVCSLFYLNLILTNAYYNKFYLERLLNCELSRKYCYMFNVYAEKCRRLKILETFKIPLCL